MCIKACSNFVIPIKSTVTDEITDTPLRRCLIDKLDLCYSDLVFHTYRSMFQSSVEGVFEGFPPLALVSF
jgi:hypothetical protein